MKRSQGIDFLRGLCILAVVAHHANLRLRYGALLPDMLNRALFWSGSPAVKVFFVISGFLITSTILKRWGTLGNIDVKRFYQLRVARIAPCLLALLAILSALHLSQVPGFVINPARATLPRALIAALTFHINWLEIHVGYLPGPWDILWSLSVEEAFYMLYPLLCRYAKQRWILPSIAVALMVAGPLSRTILAGKNMADDYAWLANMDCITIGCIAAIMPKLRFRRTLQFTGCAVLLLILVFRHARGQLGLNQTGLDVTVLALGTACLLLAIPRVPFTSFFRWFGRNSYEVYLTHMFVVTWGTQLFTAVHAPLKSAPLWFAAIIGIAGVLGHLVAKYFSEPIHHRMFRPEEVAPVPLGVRDNNTLI